MNLPKSYIRVAREITGFWGTYLPSVDMAPGMIGRSVNGVFERETELSRRLGFDRSKHAVQEQATGDPVNVWTSRNVSMEVIGGSANVKVADAAVRFRFNAASEAAIVCYGAREASFVDLQEVKDFMWELRESGEWKKGQCLVTEVMRVDAAFICFSTERGQEAEIKGSTPFALPVTPVALLGSLAGKATLEASSRDAQVSGFYTGLPSGGTPLFRAIQFKAAWWNLGKPDIVHAKSTGSEFEEPEFGDVQE
jgi:hypothetical protein